MKMVASETVSFPSKPSSTGENNENESSQDKTTTPKFKKMAPKHFMSPTISASSKAASRKKVLSERNDSDSEEHGQKSYFDMRRSPKKSSSNSLASRSSSRIVISSYDHASSEPDNDDGLSLKGYDPQRNYLSPRPKFLRFNPNRRHEIFNRLEKQDLDSSFDSKDASDEVESASSVEEVKDSSFSSPPKEIFLKTKNEENLEEEGEIVSDGYYFEEEEEEEEEIKERGWCFKGVVKLVFTLVACFLSTSYICSMNSRSSSPTQSAALWTNVTESYPTIKKETFELIGMEIRSSDLLKVGDNYSEGYEVEIYEEENGDSEESVEAGIVEDNVENLEFVGIEDKIDEGAEIEVVRIDEIEYEIKNLDEVTAVKTDESTEASSYLGLNEDTNVDEVEVSVKSIPHEPTEEILELHDTLSDNKVDEVVVVYDNEAEIEKVGWKNIPAAVGVVITSLILTLFGIVYRSKKTRRSTSVENPEFVLKPHKFAAETVQRKIEFSARPPPPTTSHPAEEASGIRAPAAELIGEIVIGKMSNLKISGEKNQMTESETRPISPVTVRRIKKKEYYHLELNREAKVEEKP
ncbi:hypothetical protein ACP275_09G121700 [Erythranthe tilingii]